MLIRFLPFMLCVSLCVPLSVVTADTDDGGVGIDNVRVNDIGIGIDNVIGIGIDNVSGYRPPS